MHAVIDDVRQLTATPNGHIVRRSDIAGIGILRAQRRIPRIVVAVLGQILVASGIVAIIALTASLLVGCDGSERPPNIVLIISDDHGYPDFGFMGASVVKTPRLDRLAAEGTLFPFGYSTASVCQPALASLLTGLYPNQRTVLVRALRARGIRRPPYTEIQDLVTLPRLLSANGYATFQGGKHWEGAYALAGFTHGTAETPRDNALRNRAGGAGAELGRTTLEPLFDFIDAQHDRPFFVWFAPKLPHTPFDASPQFREAYASAPPGTVGYYANIARLDERVGELLDHLEAHDLMRSTLVIFVSDNGWEVVPDMPDTLQWLRGGGSRGKFSLYELGIRTPVVLRWPGRIPAGARRDAFVSFVDVMPTLLDYAGIPVPAGLPGRSVRPVIEGRTDGVRDAVIGTMAIARRDAAAGPPPVGGPGGEFIRTRQWYYFGYYGEDRHELYDMESDPDQQHDVSAVHPQVVNHLRQRIRRWKVDTEHLAELEALTSIQEAPPR
jgi:arylsulfatase A